MTEILKPSSTGSTQLIVNRVRSLVHYWLGLWDKNSGDGAPLLALLSPNGFEIHSGTVSEPIKTAEAFLNWFSSFAKKVKVTNHYADNFSIQAAGQNRHQISFSIACPGIAATGEEFLATSRHEWQVVEYGGMFPLIEKITINLSVKK